MRTNIEPTQTNPLAPLLAQVEWMRAQHTPLPWYFRPEEPSIEAEHPENEGFFCTVADCGKSRTLSNEAMQANARIICLAVNHHAALVSALRSLLELCEGNAGNALKRMDQARAVLASVEGAQ